MVTPQESSTMKTTKAEKVLDRAIKKAESAKNELEKARAKRIENVESVLVLHAFARARDKWEKATRAVDRARVELVWEKAASTP
jgi:hypothetical protein